VSAAEREAPFGAVALRVEVMSVQGLGGRVSVHLWRRLRWRLCLRSSSSRATHHSDNSSPAVMGIEAAWPVVQSEAGVGLQSVGAHCLRAFAKSSHVAIAKITAKKHRMTAIPLNTVKHKVATTPRSPS
jgi:hypothetical protein